MLEWTYRQLHTAQPFGIARWTHQSYERGFVTFTQDSLSGRGEAAPNAYYGETGATMRAVADLLSEALTDPWDWQGLQAGLDARMPHNHPSVKCALSMAALEWCALAVKLPVWQLLGLSASALPETSYTVSIAEIPDMQRQASEALAGGHTILKVKLGTPQDEQIVEALREVAPTAALRVDANAAWTPPAGPATAGGAGGRQRGIAGTAAGGGDLEGHAGLRRVSRLPIIADESLHSVQDIPKLAEAFDGLNFKTAKLGGPLRVLEGIRAARALNMSVMLGCMIESSLGIAGAAHLAGLADWVDLDGALLLADDPFEGLIWQAGTLTRPQGAGWGVRER